MTQPKLNEFCKEVFRGNKAKGFDVSKENIGQTLMLIVSELSEALEALRKNKRANIDLFDFDHVFQSDIIPEDERFKKAFTQSIKDTFEDEIADSFIRLFDLVGGLGIDIDFHIEQKLKFNKTREHKHGKLF